MNITREQWMAIARIVLTALLAIGAVLGYDVGIIQPREASLAGTGGLGPQGLGQVRFCATGVYSGTTPAFTVVMPYTTVLGASLCPVVFVMGR